jgi:hypothetical protein
VLHLVGLVFDIYTTVSWWDILTHAMGGSGVAALAFLTHRKHPSARNSVRWVVPTVVAIGSGFEVYEFVFKTFWYEWTVWEYAIDTAVDLGVNTLGAVFVAFGVSLHRTETEQIQPNPSNMDHSD